MSGYFENDLWKLEYKKASANMGGSSINVYDVAFKKKATVKDLIETIINLPRSERESEWGSVIVDNIFVLRFNDKMEINHPRYINVKDLEIKKCTCGQEWNQYCFEVIL